MKLTHFANDSNSAWSLGVPAGMLSRRRMRRLVSHVSTVTNCGPLLPVAHADRSKLHFSDAFFHFQIGNYGFSVHERQGHLYHFVIIPKGSVPKETIAAVQAVLASALDYRWFLWAPLIAAPLLFVAMVVYGLARFLVK